MYHDYDVLDGFSALFGDGTVLLPRRSLSLGASAVDMLNLEDETLEQLDIAAQTARRDLFAYLSGEDDASATAFTQEALREFFSLLFRLPVYREINAERVPDVSVLRAHPELRERMRTAGTDEYAETMTWLEHLHELVFSLRAFRERATLLLEQGFAQVTERNASGYAQSLSAYYTHVKLEGRYLSDALEQEEPHGGRYENLRREYQRDLDRAFFPQTFPLKVSYCAVPHPKTEGKYLLAEEVFFRDLNCFLSLDLMRGLAAGQLPRKCAHCGRWFLLESGHDTRYCENPAPGEPDKTCRQVGAHRKETHLNGTVEIREEYTRVSNRLKGQKFRGTLSVDDWNDMMRQVQDLRAAALAGKLTVAELRARYDGISMRR